MSGHDQVRVWKDPDERGASAHPSGEINLTVAGGLDRVGPTTSFTVHCYPSVDGTCPLTFTQPICPPLTRP
jgi:hypothetical protein